MNKSFYISLFTILLSIKSEDNRIITTLKYSRNPVKPTILNGIPARKGEVPYLVSIKEAVQKFKKTELWRNLCGGSIIGKTQILTAAHCFEANNFYYAKWPTKLRIVAGNLRNDFIHSGFTQTSKEAQWRNATKIVIHNSFYFPANDIALVFINEAWNYTKYVDYVAVALKKVDYSGHCYAYGFGSNAKLRKMTQLLYMAKINVLSKMQCNILWEMNMDDFVCSNSAMSDVSNGDSGGPLACKETLDPAEKDGRDLLVGVVSGKNFDKTTLFTRVAAYKDWIGRNGCVHKTIILNFVINICMLIVI